MKYIKVEFQLSDRSINNNVLPKGEKHQRVLATHSLPPSKRTISNKAINLSNTLLAAIWF